MDSYYNFRQTENEISYEPYLYDSNDTLAYIFLGVALMIAGFILTGFKILNEAVYVGLIFGGILLIAGLYRRLIKNKAKLVFDKPDDAVFKISPTGRKKLIALSNVYEIITVSENMSYDYELTNKDKPSAKNIPITSFITERRRKRPETGFLEGTIIPAVESMIHSVKVDSPFS